LLSSLSEHSAIRQIGWDRARSRFSPVGLQNVIKEPRDISECQYVTRMGRVRHG